MMKVLLVLNSGDSKDFKVLVSLHTKQLVEQVNRLMSQEKSREAFKVIMSNAEFENYIPAGHKVNIKPKWTLVEDLL